LSLKISLPAAFTPGMGSLDYHRTVIAYHGCDRETLRAVLDGQPLQNSERAYDWLGRGVYFWEHGPRRALEWAQAKVDRADGTIKEPAVLGAYIHLGQCFDLLDTKNTTLLTQAYPRFVEKMNLHGWELPRNKDPQSRRDNELSLRFLDCAMLNWALEDFAEAGQPYQTVRGAFVEGEPCFPGSKLMTKTHIQVAVRDWSCILGVFRPQY
jgi:hypothetical protein